MREEKKAICPRCHGEYIESMPALSRADNATDICGACGTEEAMLSFRMAHQGHTREEIKAELLRILRHQPTY